MGFLRRDVREAGWEIEISQDQKVLRIGKFSTGENGVPRYDSGGFMACESPVVFAFSGDGASGRGILSRNGKRILSHLNDISFSLTSQLISDQPVPCIRVRIVFEASRDNQNEFIGLIVPRHLASWARHRYWVSTSNGQRLKYKFLEQGK